MREIRGQITIVQESRFQVTDEMGVSHLFLLSPHAAAEPAQLIPLARGQARVRVRWTGTENEIGSIATRIDVEDPSRQGGGP